MLDAETCRTLRDTARATAERMEELEGELDRVKAGGQEQQEALKTELEQVSRPDPNPSCP